MVNALRFLFVLVFLAGCNSAPPTIPTQTATSTPIPTIEATATTQATATVTTKVQPSATPRDGVYTVIPHGMAWIIPSSRVRFIVDVPDIPDFNVFVSWTTLEQFGEVLGLSPKHAVNIVFVQGGQIVHDVRSTETIYIPVGDPIEMSASTFTAWCLLSGSGDDECFGAGIAGAAVQNGITYDEYVASLKGTPYVPVSHEDFDALFNALDPHHGPATGFVGQDVYAPNMFPESSS